jgi:methylated-DNA-[protein]-cysteine S-methyltransferase
MEKTRISPFQKAVYDLVASIPAGQTRTYGEIARLLGKPGASRAVGQALRRNPFPPDRVPCHRVIHSSGRVEGYFGSLDPGSSENREKRRKLRFEGALPSDRD